MDRIEIRRRCGEVFSQQEQLVAAFDADDVNKLPFEGSWTAGQVLQHINMSNSVFLEILNGDVRDTGRPADLIISDIECDLLDLNANMKLAELLVPENKLYELVVLCRQAQEIYLRTSFIIDNLDLTKTCTSFGVPKYGFLTRMEVIYFVICHTKRHNHQLRNIIHLLSDSKKINIFGWLVFEFLSHSGDRMSGSDMPYF